MDECPFDVIIGQELLYDGDAYNIHQNSLVTGLSEVDLGLFCGVSFWPSFLPLFSKTKRSSMNNSGREQPMLSDVEREVERRIRAESLIDSIHDGARREAARLGEEQRQTHWASSRSGNQGPGRQNVAPNSANGGSSAPSA